MRLIDPLLAVPARPLLAGIDMSQPDFKCKPVFCVKKINYMHSQTPLSFMPVTSARRRCVGRYYSLLMTCNNTCVY